MKKGAVQILFLFLLCSALRGSGQALPEDSLLFRINKAIESNDRIAECKSTYAVAAFYWRNGNAEPSIEYAEKACKLAEEVGDTNILINALNVIGQNFMQKGEWEKAVEKYNRSASLSELSHDTLLLANTTEYLSIIYSSAGHTDYPRALDLLYKAARLKENLKAYNQLAGTYKNISAIFKELKDTLNREKYLLKAVAVLEQADAVNPTFKAAAFNEAGRFYTDEKPDYPRADEYYSRVLEISRQINWQRGIAVSLTNKATVKEKQGDLDRALELHNEALKLKQGMNDAYGMLNSFLGIGQILKKQKKYGEAVRNIETAEKIAVANHFSHELKEEYKTLYEIYSETGDYKKALGYHEKYTALSDSLSGETNRKMIAEMETKYDTEKKEQEIAGLTIERENESLKARQRTYIAVILAAMLAIAFFIIRQNRLRGQRTESELKQKLFRSQMNPHFIFNALGSIQNYIFTNEPGEAARYLSNFASLMRDILESSYNERIPLQQEIKIVENYLSLQKMRKEDSFDYSVCCVADCEQYMVPPMLAQPFVENALLHGFKGLDGIGRLNVEYKIDGRFFIIRVEDNGVGINHSEKKPGHKPVAVELTRKRLKIFSPKTGLRGLAITDLSERGSRGTLVEITLPVDKCLRF